MGDTAEDSSAAEVSTVVEDNAAAEHNAAAEDSSAVEAINIEDTPHTVDDVVFFQDPEPVMDVYLMPTSGFDDFEYKAGRYKLLTSDGTWDGDMFEIECVWDRDDFENAMDAGTREFAVHGKYVPPEPDSGFWDEETQRLWEAGQIQIKGGMDLCVNVHIRPDDYVTVYRPDPEMQIQTIWVDRDNPTDFCNLYLMSYDSLTQEESPYDTLSLEFEILWDEASYTAGLESKADQFEITGSYGGLWSGEPWQVELWAEGLIQTQGSTKTIICVRDTENQVYVNPYDNQVGYVWPCEFQIYIRPGTTYEAAVFPLSGGLEPESGDLEQIRDFGLEWSRSDYEAGITSGRESFTVSGRYGPNPDWTTEDQERFADGRFRIAEDTPSPKLTVHIIKGELPFTVVMQKRDGLIPIFKFPWPNGAAKVSCDFSFDKETWYSEEIWWSSEYDNNLAVGIAAVYDENDRMISIPEDDPFPFYCKLTVTESVFEGETKVMIISPDANGKWNMEEDQGGDHGGGGQGEHDRPGKDDSNDSNQDVPDRPGNDDSYRPNKDDSDQTQNNPSDSDNGPEVPSGEKSPSINVRPVQPIQKSPMTPIRKPVQESPASPTGKPTQEPQISPTENSVETASVPSDTDGTQEEPPQETSQNTGDSHSDTEKADAAANTSRPLSGPIKKYMGFAAATLLLIISGAAFTWLYQKKKK